MRRLAAVLVLLVVTVAPALAQGPWTTYLRMRTCNDLLALRDTVWVASGEAGLLRWSRANGTWTSITRVPGGLAGNDVGPLALDRSGNLFCGVPGKGVSRLDRNGRWALLNAFDGLPSDTVLTMRAQGDSIWIGTTRGLALWDGEGIAGSVPDLGTASPFVDDRINGIVITGDTLFASSPKGVHIARLSQRLATWTLIPTGLPIGVNLNIRGIAGDGRNVLALASGQNPNNPAQPVLTSFRWFPSQNRWGSDFPANSAVRRLRDDFGVVLATTANVGPNAGVYRWSSSGWTFLTGSPVTDNSDGPALEVGAAPDGVVFASTVGQLLDQSATWSPNAPPGPVGNNCRNILVTRDGVYASYNGEGVSRLRDGVWRNYPAGTSCVGPACDTTFVSPSFPGGMTVDPSGRKWIGVWGGPLTRIDDSTNPPGFLNLQFVSSNADSTHLHTCIHAAAADSTVGSQAGVWFGLDSDRIGCTSCTTGDPLGLDVYAADGRYVQSFDSRYPGIKNGLIRGLGYNVRANEMWVGFKQSGLSTFAVRDSLHQPIVLEDVTAAGNLDVFGLAVYGDSVWVLAAEGLRRFRASTKSLATTLSIAGPPSLASMSPIAVGPDGTVYVGTDAGLRVHRRGVPPVDYDPDNSPLADPSVRAVSVGADGVVWIATAAGINRFDPDYVAPPEPTLPSLRVRLYPNPAWLTGIGFQLRLDGEASSYVGEVLDLAGRLVHRFSAASNGAVFWDGRDLDRRAVEPGIYFVRVRGGGAEATSRVVVLR